MCVVLLMRIVYKRSRPCSYIILANLTNTVYALDTSGGQVVNPQSRAEYLAQNRARGRIDAVALQVELA